VRHIAPSKLSFPIRVPATALTLTTVRTTEPPFTCAAHATVVADVHALLPHTSAAAIEAVVVAPAAPKLSPLIVTVPPTHDAALLGSMPLTTGAATGEGMDARQHITGDRSKMSHTAENVPSKVKLRLAVVLKSLIHASRPSDAPARTGFEAVHISCVFVVHEVVAHGWPETYAEGLKSVVPKPVPRIATVVEPETGVFRGQKEEMLAH
jgi:hypothetical protein